MTYSDVPQGNQRISATQPLIRGNFQFIEDDFQEDHVFNGNVVGQAEGTHQKMSLKGIAQPAVAPAGIDGIAYLGTDSNFKLWKSGATQSLNMSVYAISAAVNFNGSTGAITSSYNVSSITLGGSSIYTVNFTNSLVSDDYIVQITCMRNNSGDAGYGCIYGNAVYGNSIKTTSVKIQTFGSTSSPQDCLVVNVVVFGGQ